MKQKFAYPLYFYIHGISEKEIGDCYEVTESRISQILKEAKKQLKTILNSDRFLKQMKKCDLAYNGNRYKQITKSEAMKKLYRKKYNLKSHQKHYKENPDYYIQKRKIRKRINSPSENRRQRVARNVAHPEKIRKKVRKYREKNKEWINERDKKRCKKPERIAWRKEYESRPNVKERIKLVQKINTIQGRLKGTTIRGFYKTESAKQRAIKRLKELKKIFGKDKRFAENK